MIRCSFTPKRLAQTHRELPRSLARRRRRLAEEFYSDDSMAMTPAMVLSKFEQVTVEARI